MSNTQETDFEVFPTTQTSNKEDAIEKFRDTSLHIYRALFLKSLSLQLRQKKTNIIQLIFVALLMVVLGLLSITGRSIDSSFPAITPPPQYLRFNTSNALGYRRCSPINATDYIACSLYHYLFYTDSTNTVGALPNMTQGYGLLGEIPQEPFRNFNYDNVYQVPFFHDKYSSAIEVDNKIIDATRVAEAEQTRTNYYGSTQVYNIPTAALLVQSATLAPDTSYTAIEYTIQVPSDDSYAYASLGRYEGIPQATNRQQYYVNMMTNALVTNMTGKSNFITSVTQSFSYLRVSVPFRFADLVSLIALFFLPSVIMFSLPIFVFAVVYEKQEKLTEMMKMMGVSMNYYWTSQYLYSFIVYCVMTLFVIISGAAFGLNFFVAVNPMTYILLFLFYGGAHVAMSFLISCFFSKARGANIFSYFFCLLIAAASSVVMLIVNDDKTLSWLMLFPPFAVQRGIYIITYTTTGSHPENFASLTHASPLLGVYLYLFLETIVMLVLTWYLDHVLPREHGLNYPVLFPLYSIKWLKGKMPKWGGMADDEDEHVGLLAKDVSVDIADDVSEAEDPDCASIRKTVHTDIDLFVKIVDLHKRYPAKAGQASKDALNQFCLALNKGECLGLLGPNGAGKTTLISILCGMSKPSSGYALIDGLNIRNEMYKVHKILGLCPQHDILWQDLTVEDHLLFYSRLKGYNKHVERAHVLEIANMMALGGPHLTKLTSELSGGMKRRLSIAISLVGSSELVLMDEPTTGLDPETRRSVWDVINNNKKGRSIIITTHNMEEADVLCGQIAIMSRGSLKCYGSPLYLKNKFGAGYKLSLCIKPNSFESVDRYIKNMFPSATIDHTMGTSNVEYVIPVEQMNIGKLFSEMKHKNPDVIEWGVNQMSLEEVFLKMIEKDEK